MNCKPGDLALVVADPYGYGLYGRLVEVLYAAPSHRFQLPDGYWHIGNRGSNVRWVVHLLGSPARCPVGLRGSGNARWAMYGTMADWGLRPLPGIPEERREEIEAPVC